jgi:hypothetical protein
MDDKLLEKIAKCLSPGLLPGQDMFEEEGYYFIKPERRLEIANVILTLINDNPSPASVEEIKLVSNLHDAADKLNGELGTKEKLCLFCGSDSYDHAGIVHETNCLLAKARQLLTLLTPELTVKREPIMKNASEVAGIYEISGDIDPIDYVRGLRRPELTLISDEDIQNIRNKITPWDSDAFAKRVAQAQLAADINVRGSKNAENKS